MVLLIPARIRELKEKGRQEERAQWEEWYKRWKEAIGNGGPVPEPPPRLSEDANNS